MGFTKKLIVGECNVNGKLYELIYFEEYKLGQAISIPNSAVTQSGTGGETVFAVGVTSPEDAKRELIRKLQEAHPGKQVQC